jgi:hypothetical protein
MKRTKWRYNSNLKAMERARKRINRGIRTYYYKSNAKVITHADLQDGHKALYADDGEDQQRIWQHLADDKSCIN